MPKIKTLDSALISKIAAGQVVERPASVVKELIENSLDAQATHILIEIENAGFKKIRVVDNGEGMDTQDLLKCFLSHTTSKINSAEDLPHIKTLGFRGEALASICAVSEVIIKTKTATSQSGSLLNLALGEPKIASAAMNTGTIVEVIDLFKKVPARKKFLKSENTEYLNILNLFLQYALGYTNVGFELIKDGKQIIKISAKDTIEQRLAKVLGQNILNQMFRKNYADNYLKAEIYISHPQISTKTKSTGFIFVNKRPIRNLKIAKAIKQAYKTLLDKSYFPQFVLFLELNHDLVDINIHPRKEEVRFWDEPHVLAAISSAVEKTLAENEISFDYANPDVNGRGAIDYTFNKLKDSVPAWHVRGNTDSDPYEHTFQVDRTYIAYTDNNGLILVDQHAAHESILYDQFKNQYVSDLKSKTLPKHPLKAPLVIETSVVNKNIIESNLEKLTELGFEIETFGNNSYKVSAVPEFFKEHNLADLILEILENDDNFGGTFYVDEKTDKTIAYLSCRTAIKAGDFLSGEEQKKLLLKLDECSHLHTCPHGRPIKIKISSRELAKMFKRIK